MAGNPALLMAALPAGNPFISPTAVQGQQDKCDDFVYSSLVVAYGGTASQSVFTSARGQTIPAMKGSAITVAAAHHLVHSELTTNLTENGRLGGELGDAVLRSIAINIEEAPLLGTNGTAHETTGYAAFGATPQDAMDFIAKTSFNFQLGGKKVIRGPVRGFPALGGPSGVIAAGVTANNVNRLFGVMANGSPLSGGKKLLIGIGIARTDTIMGELATGNGATYAFVTTSGAGQEALVTVLCAATLMRDAR